MFITTFVLFALVMCFAVITIRNNTSLVLSFYFISLGVMMLAASIYISKLTYYSFPLRWDYLLYLWLSNIRISIMSISRLYALSFALFMFSSICGLCHICDLKIKHFLVLSIPVLLFALLTDPSVALKINLLQHTADYKYKYAIGLLARGRSVLCFCLIVFYTLFPYYPIVKRFFKTDYDAERRYILCYCAFITIINLFFYMTFIFGVFSNIMFYNTTPIGVPKRELNINSYTAVPLWTFAVLFVFIFIIIFFKPFNLFYSERKKNNEFLKNSMFLNRSLRTNLHMYKNIFWAAQQQFELISNALRANDLESIQEYTDNGFQMMKDQLETLNKTLNQLKFQKSASLHLIDIAECINTAIKQVQTPSDIKILKNFTVSEANFLGNNTDFVEVFRNILINSIESFGSAPQKTYYIQIDLTFKWNMYIIAITDNGCGIERSALKNIFKPFYSTKSRIKNSGTGLNFVENIIKSYQGRISVKSKEGEYTTFQIALPVSKKIIKLEHLLDTKQQNV